MALNQSKVGSAYPPYRYEVSREKIREYAMALGETDPRYSSDGDDCVAPPTFAAAFTLSKGLMTLLGDAELGAHMALVHGSQAFTWGERPLRPGDVLVCTPRIETIAVRGRNEFLTTVVDCVFADDGELAVRAEVVIVFLGSAPVEEAAADAQTDARADAQGGAA
jgi:hypothetical protein